MLSNENKANKQQMQTLLDKGKHDDELITALFVRTSMALTDLCINLQSCAFILNNTT